MGQSLGIYKSYVDDVTKRNVKPVIIDGDAVFALLRDAGAKFNEPASYETRYWGERGRRFNLADGRVVEYSQTNTAIGTPLLAIFENAVDYFNYRRPLDAHTYLWR